MEAALESHGLTKEFGHQRAVDGLDLQVPRGSVYGFLGPNGSGKTTTIRMLLGLVRPTSGTHSVLGRPMPEQQTDALHRVGSLIEGPAFHPYLSGRANLARLDAADSRAEARTSGARIDAALERVGLSAAAAKRYRAYSLGMKQRLAVAAALLGPRELLVLDEPTNGLDPQGTREIRHLISGLAAEGITVFVSSHLLSEVEQVCTHLGIMRSGHLVAQGEIGRLRQDQPRRVVVRTPDTADAVRVLAGQSVTAISALDEQVVGLPDDRPPERIVRALVEAGVRVRGFEVERPSLEDYFVGLTGEGFDVRA